MRGKSQTKMSAEFGEIINEIRIRLPSYSVNESAARAMVGAFCAQLDPAASELADIKCAVSEAVTNCIVHAYRDTVGIIYITVRLYEKRLVSVEIRDKGRGIEDVKLATESKRPVALCNRTGGMIPTPDEVLSAIRKAEKGEF